MSQIANATRVFRPSVGTYARSTLAGVGVAVPVLAALFFVNEQKAWFLLLCGGAAGASVLGVLLYIARARVYLTPELIGKRGFGRTRWMSRNAVHRGLLVLKLSSGTNSPMHLFLFAPDSALVMRLYGALWGEEQLRALVDALGIEQSVRAMPISAAELGALEPTALNWAESHPRDLNALALGIFAVVVVVVVLVIATR